LRAWRRFACRDGAVKAAAHGILAERSSAKFFFLRYEGLPWCGPKHGLCEHPDPVLPFFSRGADRRKAAKEAVCGSVLVLAQFGSGESDVYARFGAGKSDIMQ
jgi:hypothetical protein